MNIPLPSPLLSFCRATYPSDARLEQFRTMYILNCVSAFRKIYWAITMLRTIGDYGIIEVISFPSIFLYSYMVKCNLPTSVSSADSGIVY